MSSRLDYCNSLLYGIANIDLTRLQRVQNRLAHLVTKSPPFSHSVPLVCSLHWLPVRFRTLLKSICWPTKPCVKNSLFIFTPCLPHHSHLVHWDQTKIIVCQSLGSRATQVQELFTLVLRLFGTTSRCLSIQPFQLLPSRNIWRHISFTWPFPLRHRHVWWPIDVTELFLWFCCWTLIRLSRPRAWLCWGYWRYRNLIDWLIEYHIYFHVRLSWESKLCPWQPLALKRHESCRQHWKQWNNEMMGRQSRTRNRSGSTLWQSVPWRSDWTKWWRRTRITKQSWHTWRKLCKVSTEKLPREVNKSRNFTESRIRFFLRKGSIWMIELIEWDL